MARYDVAIIGAGPAGLSAALVLGRCRRHVVVLDHGKPRNYAAVAVNSYLGLDGIEPAKLREAGRREAASYGIEFLDVEAVGVCPCGPDGRDFEVRIEGRSPIVARKLLLATGVRDVLPNIEGVADFYGKSVHHCPYCDGWEHRDQRLAALGDGSEAVGLALSLRAWSPQVTACTNGRRLSEEDRERATSNQIACREETVTRLAGRDGVLEALHFASGPPLPCDALFFSSEHGQRSELPLALGCEYDGQGHVHTKGKQGAGVRGLFLAGDADGDVQLAIVAAAEGAIAATAINRELQDEDCGDGHDRDDAAPLRKAAEEHGSRR